MNIIYTAKTLHQLHTYILIHCSNAHENVYKAIMIIYEWLRHKVPACYLKLHEEGDVEYQHLFGINTMS